MNARTPALVALALTALTTQAAHANLVEDGAAFTGIYRVQEDPCKKSAFNYETGKTDLIDLFTFEGTAEGLKIDGNLHAVANGDVFGAQPNSATTTHAAYLSPTEFQSYSVFHLERDNVPVQMFSEDYSLDAAGNITLKKTRSGTPDATPQDNETCHFVRQPNP